MGWVSCLEDAQERLDDMLNTIQGLSTNVGSSTWRDLDRMRQTLDRLQVQLDALVEVVTDPTLGSKIELHELREVYAQVKLENQQLRQELSEKQSLCTEYLKEIEETNSQLAEIANSLRIERDIAENLTNRCLKEQRRREKVEAKLEALNKAQQEEISSNHKKYFKKR